MQVKEELQCRGSITPLSVKELAALVLCCDWLIRKWDDDDRG